MRYLLLLLLVTACVGIAPVSDTTGVQHVYNLTASNNPADYLGNEIGYEQVSDWHTYQHLVEQVVEITKGLNTDKEKTRAIADWVKQSKANAGEEISVANKGATIIDIFNAEKGVCLDAAYLTTAMLRMAGIPARAVAPDRGVMHEQTEAYIDGKWVLIDATFGQGGASYEDQSSIARKDIHEYAGYYDKDKTFMFFVKGRPKEEYGFVQYPYVSEERIDSWYETWPKNFSFAAEKAFRCTLNQKERGDVVRISNTGFYEVGEGTQPNRDKTKKFTDADGIISTALPPGVYRLECTIANVFDQKPPYQTVATDFRIEPGETVRIETQDFWKVEGAPQKEFDALIELMRQSQKT